jgi:hypothetical protein
VRGNQKAFSIVRVAHRGGGTRAGHEPAAPATGALAAVQGYASPQSIPLPP